MDISAARSALAHPNVIALLRVLREGESSQTDDAYHMMFGGEHFVGFDKHPNRAVTRTLRNGKTVTSTAAGAYQFLASTWAECKTALNLPDFGPDSQDLGAIFLIDRRKALQPILRGDLDTAIAKLNREWASLPGSPYGQGELTMDRVRAVYAQYGGGSTQAPSENPIQEPIAAPTPTPSKAKPMAILSILSAALPLLSQYIPDLAKLFPKSEVAERNVKVVETAVNIVKDAVGARNTEEAIEILSSDPNAVIAAQQAIKDNWFQLTDVGGGVEAAHKRNMELMSKSTNPISNPAFIVSMILLSMVFMMLADVFFVHPDRYTGNLLTQVVTAILLIIGMVGGYWIGTSFSSARKTELTRRNA